MHAIQITIRDIPFSPALENHIREKAEKLTQFYDRINSCRVVVKVPKKHLHQGKIYNIRIDLKVPGKELVVTRKYDQDIYIAIRDAFAAIERQLEEHAHKRNGQIKVHDGVMHGHIVRMSPDEGFGFIHGVDNTEYYFSVTNVSHPSFNQLSIGDAVEFIAEPVNDGWQAHRVIKSRHNHHE